MSSKYDSINTAAELVSEVQLHGLSTTQEDICRAQDIFGHTSIEELARLANDIGRNNRNGEPDPKGACSSNRPATQSTFYSILSNIWHWEEVTWFWNTYTNPQTEELKKVRLANDELRKENDRLKAEYEEIISLDDVVDAIHIVSEKRSALEDEIENAKERIVEQADQPNGAGFSNAVLDHRAAKAEFDQCTALMQRLCNVHHKYLRTRKEAV